MSIFAAARKLRVDRETQAQGVALDSFVQLSYLIVLGGATDKAQFSELCRAVEVARLRCEMATQSF